MLTVLGEPEEWVGWMVQANQMLATGQVREAQALREQALEAAPAIRRALEERAAHGVYGYARNTGRYLESVASWMQRRQGWTVEHDWIVPVPGVVPALHHIVRRVDDPDWPNPVWLSTHKPHPMDFPELVEVSSKLRDSLGSAINTSV